MYIKKKIQKNPRPTDQNYFPCVTRTTGFNFSFIYLALIKAFLIDRSFLYWIDGRNWPIGPLIISHDQTHNQVSLLETTKSFVG